MRPGKSVVVLLALLCACSSQHGSGTARNAAATEPASTLPAGVVLITAEAIRADLLSTYGGPVPMPALDRLAATGVVFDNAAAVCPMARPAIATLLTGVAPDRSGVRDNTADPLPADLPILAKVYRKAGWKTAAFVGSQFSSYGSGFDRGFEVFDGPERIAVGPARFFPKPRPGKEAAAHLVQWLGSLGKDDRFFAWVHLADLHPTWVEGPDEQAGKRYREALGALDGTVKAVLDAIDGVGRSGPIEVVFVGTQGVHLGEDGKRGDSFWLDPATLRIPLVWTGSRAAAARAASGRDPRPVWLPDVAATLAGIVGGGLSPRAEGIDFGRGTDNLAERKRMAWTWAPDDQLAWPPLTAVADGAGWRVFDEAAIEKLRQGPTSIQAGSAEAVAVARPAVLRPQSISAATRKRLEDLGLKLGRVRPDAEPPPKAADLIARLNEVRLFLAQNRFRPAVRRSEKLFAEYPDNLGVLTFRLFAMMELGVKEQLVKEAGRLLDRFPERQESLHWSAHAFLVNRKLDEAEALLAAAEEAGSREAELIYDTACVKALKGDTAGALASLERSYEAGYRELSWIEDDPDLAPIRSSPGYLDFMKRHAR
jgi:hypothetical protein